MHYRQLEVVVA